MLRRAGFRFSVSDAVVLAASVPATWWLWSVVGTMAGVVPFAVGHFFLFCNVFRIHRRKELLWASCCLLNVAAWSLAERVDWWLILAVQSPLTVLVIVWEMSGPYYHGICARRINRRLDDYLSGRQAEGAEA